MKLETNVCGSGMSADLRNCPRLLIPILGPGLPCAQAHPNEDSQLKSRHVETFVSKFFSVDDRSARKGSSPAIDPSDCLLLGSYHRGRRLWDKGHMSGELIGSWPEIRAKGHEL